MRQEGPFHVKYRPQSFNEIVGNSQTIVSLKDCLGKPDCPHSFLLHGPSGTGKTTLARIIRKELDCGDMDYMELNAANTRGIDTIREVINNCGYAPISGKTRVFLFDEAHQITGPAMEALLKITEDTPPHVFFILSTTNPEKIISTLRKRCSTYKLSLLTRREISNLLIWVMTEEGFSQEDIDYFTEVIHQIARISDGSPREALILLNQVIPLNKSQALEMIKNHILSGETTVIELCQQLLGPEDWSAVSQTLKKLEGDVEQLRRGILTYMSKVLLNKGDPAAANIMLFFRNNFYDSGMAGLIFACYNAKMKKF